MDEAARRVAMCQMIAVDPKMLFTVVQNSPYPSRQLPLCTPDGTVAVLLNQVLLRVVRLRHRRVTAQRARDLIHTDYWYSTPFVACVRLELMRELVEGTYRSTTAAMVDELARQDAVRRWRASHAPLLPTMPAPSGLRTGHALYALYCLVAGASRPVLVVQMYSYTPAKRWALVREPGWLDPLVERVTLEVMAMRYPRTDPAELWVLLERDHARDPLLVHCLRRQLLVHASALCLLSPLQREEALAARIDALAAWRRHHHHHHHGRAGHRGGHRGAHTGAAGAASAASTAASSSSVALFGELLPPATRAPTRRGGGGGPRASSDTATAATAVADSAAVVAAVAAEATTVAAATAATAADSVAAVASAVAAATRATGSATAAAAAAEAVLARAEARAADAAPEAAAAVAAAITQATTAMVSAATDAITATEQLAHHAIERAASRVAAVKQEETAAAAAAAAAPLRIQLETPDGHQVRITAARVDEKTGRTHVTLVMTPTTVAPTPTPDGAVVGAPSTQAADTLLGILNHTTIQDSVSGQTFHVASIDAKGGAYTVKLLSDGSLPPSVKKEPS